jgi:DNA-binding CsgD family transcriptional regulator
MSTIKYLDKAHEFFELYKKGMSYAEIGKQYGIGRDYVGRALRAARLVKPRDRLSNIKKIIEMYVDGYSKKEISEKLGVGLPHVITTITRQKTEELINPEQDKPIIYNKPSWSPSAVASKALGTLQLMGHKVSIDTKQACFYVDGVRKDTVQLLNMLKSDHTPIKPVASHHEFKNDKPKKVIYV